MTRGNANGFAFFFFSLASAGFSYWAANVLCPNGDADDGLRACVVAVAFFLACLGMAVLVVLLLTTSQRWIVRFRPALLTYAGAVLMIDVTACAWLVPIYINSVAGRDSLAWVWAFVVTSMPLFLVYAGLGAVLAGRLFSVIRQRPRAALKPKAAMPPFPPDEPPPPPEPTPVDMPRGPRSPGPLVAYAVAGGDGDSGRRVAS
jgi:hypothetical protein